MKSSITNPLRIAALSPSRAAGVIGFSPCPGMKDRSCGWDRDLNSDLAIIRKWGAEAVVTLVEPHELQLLQVASMPEAVAQHGMRWAHLPISDFSVPDPKFETKWVTIGAELRTVILRGGSILIHCRAGLGRAGMIAARLLVELGTDVQTAIDEVRSARPGAIVTLEQERHVRDCGELKWRDRATPGPWTGLRARVARFAMGSAK